MIGNMPGDRALFLFSRLKVTGSGMKEDGHLHNNGDKIVNGNCGRNAPSKRVSPPMDDLDEKNAGQIQFVEKKLNGY